MKKLFTLFLSMFLCLGLVACGSSKSNLNSEYVGKYQLVSMSDGESEYGEDLLKMAGIEYYIELQEDGTAVFDVGDGEEKGSWTNEKINLNGDKVPFTYDNGTIVLTEDSYSMTFSK